MNKLSTLPISAKIGLSLLFGFISLLLSPYGIALTVESTAVGIPWSQLFPVCIALCFGWRYALLTSFSGGIFFPFLLWPDNGWANVTTALTYLFLYTALGVAADTQYFKKIASQPLRIVIAALSYVTLNLLYDHFLFQTMLRLNPCFWTTDTINYIEQSIIYGFGVKDTINVITILLAADTLLRLPALRGLLGLPVYKEMQLNTFIFFTTIFIPVIVWLSFIGLGYALLRENNNLHYEHKSFALLVILANGFLVSRLLFYFSEKHEREMEIKNQKLMQQHKELEQFVYIASHDLQEPLQTLMSITTVLSEEYKGKLDEQGENYLTFINQSSQRMRDLIKGLVDYAKIGHTENRTLVDIRQVVNQVLSELSIPIMKSHAHVTIEQLPIVYAYPVELKQLFHQLLSNAIKFSRIGTPPEIHLTAKLQNGKWLFALSDNGIGIAEKNKEKIFVIFKRLHNRSEYGGTGIGLAYCKKIAALHNGSIWAESKPGEGSTFYFTIPVMR